MAWIIERDGCGEATLKNTVSCDEICLSAGLHTSAEEFTQMLLSLETYLNTGIDPLPESQDRLVAESLKRLTQNGALKGVEVNIVE